jgi:hypothetical protein
MHHSVDLIADTMIIDIDRGHRTICEERFQRPKVISVGHDTASNPLSMLYSAEKGLRKSHRFTLSGCYGTGNATASQGPLAMYGLTYSVTPESLTGSHHFFQQSTPVILHHKLHA